MDGYKNVELETKVDPRNRWQSGLSLTIFHLRCRPFKIGVYIKEALKITWMEGI